MSVNVDIVELDGFLLLFMKGGLFYCLRDGGYKRMFLFDLVKCWV